MTNSTENNQTKYYDLHTQGVGYVNRVREVPVKRGEPFWACSISALHGAEDSIEYTNFDCRVAGSEAAKVIKRLNKACEENKKILMGFKIGDLYPETFTYKSGKKEGQVGISQKPGYFILAGSKLMVILFTQHLPKTSLLKTRQKHNILKLSQLRQLLDN